MVVQHNMQAANANRMLGITSGAQAKSTEKLSSGYKINRAADDAAGLTISEKMRKQIRGLDKASSNAQDGVSSVQTAEGALTEVHSMLQRMNELAVQASNGTNSKDTDRKAIQDEIDQLNTEIDRVAETTKFNEIYLLKGDDGEKTINLKAHDAGLKGTLTDNGDGTATFTMDALNAGDTVSIGGKNYTIGGEAADVTAMLTKAGVTDQAGDKVTINGKEYTYFANASDGTTALTNKGYYETAPDAADKATATPAYADSAAIAAAKSATISVGTKSITTIDAQNGVDKNDNSVITKQKAYELAGKELLAANQIGDTVGNAEVKNGDKSALAYNAGDGTFNIKVGQAKVANTLSFSLHVGADADMTNKITVDIDTMNSANLGIKGLNVTDKNGTAATYAIDAISDAISKVSSQRSALGAVQNRLEHTIDNLDNISENTSSAESRIRDTDMAKEMVNYSKNNILAQAGQSMLAQANQSNQGVLSLLQ
ncbi:flagellin [Roseburia faecis]|uniref:flagellin N-terminal helical domain-containing protein n=1 Tax=Roseburia faecis TaxID=301302 RepID=UPI0032EC53E4